MLFSPYSVTVPTMWLQRSMYNRETNPLTALADPRGGGALPARSPLRSKIFLISWSFWENLKIIVCRRPLLRVGIPLLRKSWIRPWTGYHPNMILNVSLKRQYCIQSRNRRLICKYQHHRFRLTQTHTFLH